MLSHKSIILVVTNILIEVTVILIKGLVFFGHYSFFCNLVMVNNNVFFGMKFSFVGYGMTVTFYILFFYNSLFILLIMNVETLKCLLENVPDDFDVTIININVEIPLAAVEIDVENKKVLLK